MKKLLLSAFICLAIMSFGAILPAQTPQKGPGSGAYMNKGQKVTVQGKILFMKTLGGYFVKGENPSQEMIIVNQNPKVLDKFYKSGKKVTVEGYLTIGAEHLFVERIDGVKYSGAKGASSKAK